MTSCTIIISHFNSLPFLRQCIRQIVKHSHSEIETHIIVCDQSTGQEAYDVYDAMLDEGRGIKYFKLVHTKPLYSGYGIDWCIRSLDIQTDYICQVHTDIVPVSKNFLYLPIRLIEENNFSFVGQLQFINSKDNLASIYPPHPFFAMAQCFNVARTETYREMSMEAGFTRFHNRPDAGMVWNNNDWWQWAADDYEHKGSDDDVVAFAWEDKHKEHDKLGLAITGYIAPAYGRLIEDIVFHFGSCREGINGSLGAEYNDYVRRINENYSDELISEMVELAQKNRPPSMEILTRNYWNGKTKTHSPPSEELNKRIEYLKTQWYDHDTMKFMQKYW